MTPSTGFAERALRPGDLSDVAARIHSRSVEHWGPRGGVLLIGRDATLVEAQRRLVRFATSDTPVLLTGETGTGKELFARALYLMGPRCGKPFVRVNCAQFHEGNLMASELFGHKKGSFTGAVADHRGLLEEAGGGVVFLDEVGELSLSAQSMLLRALSEGEIVPVGGTAVRQVNVRVIAATSRDLLPMIAAGTFREDLYYRLRYLWVNVPPLRDRGGDWELIARHHLYVLSARHGSAKALSAAASAVLHGYAWPGNVRELFGLLDMGFCLCDGSEIGPCDMAEWLRPCTASLPRRPALPLAENGAAAHDGNGVQPEDAKAGAPCPRGRAWERMAHGGESFWAVVREPFIEHDLSRMDVREILRRGLAESGGSYKRLLTRIGVEPGDYHRFMDFLRHHRLKPEGYARGTG